MKVNEKGVLSPSEMYFNTPSEFSKNSLYYTILSGEFFCNEHYHIQRETFDSFLILLIKRGKMKINYNKRQYIAKKNDLVLLNCYNPHSYGAEGEVHFEYFHFDGHSSSNYFDLLYSKAGCVFPTQNSTAISTYINQIIKTSKSPDQNEHFISMTIHKIFYELTQITSELIIDQQIQNAISYIDNHFKQEITLEEIAANLDLSTYHFVRLFKRHTGNSPYQYILNCRIHYAKTLLQTTKYSIETVASHSGFNSTSHFVSTFKKRTNLTPRQFRHMKF